MSRFSFPSAIIDAGWLAVHCYHGLPHTYNIIISGATAHFDAGLFCRSSEISYIILLQITKR